MKTEDITAKIDEVQTQLNQRGQYLINNDAVCLSLADHKKSLNVMLETIKQPEPKANEEEVS